MVTQLKYLCLSFLDKTNVTVTGLTACFVLYTQSAGVAYFAVGATLCSFLAKAVKRLVRQPRPLKVVRGKTKKSYGMPSTHSATISFFATYIILASSYLPVHPSFRPDIFIRAAPPLIALPWAAAITMSRVWLGHHTWLQVFAGISLGTAWAGVWYALWVNGLNNVGGELEQKFHAAFSGFLIELSKREL